MERIHNIEEETLNKFFTDLYQRKLSFVLNEEERCDIRDAVIEMVNNIAERICGKDSKFKIERRLLVGSAGERTQIVQPNEYDFLLVLHALSCENDLIGVSSCPDCPGCVHIEIKKDDLKAEWNHLLVNGELVSTRGGKLDYSPFGFRQYFHQAMQMTVDLLKNEQILMKTGILFMKSSTVTKHGPAFTPNFFWQRKCNKENIQIFVDLCPVIRYMGELENMITLQNTVCDTYFNYVSKVGYVMLMPCTKAMSCERGLCFKKTFTLAEVLLMRDMSIHHRNCYKILKYILNGIIARTATVFHSYALKTLVLNHHYHEKCIENHNMAKCIMLLLRQIQSIVEESPVSFLRYDMRKRLSNVFLKNISVWNHEQSILDSDIRIRLSRLMTRLEKIANMKEYAFEHCYIRSVNCSNLNKVYVPVGFILYEFLDHLFKKQ